MESRRKSRSIAVTAAYRKPPVGGTCCSLVESAYPQLLQLQAASVTPEATAI